MTETLEQQLNFVNEPTPKGIRLRAARDLNRLHGKGTYEITHITDVAANTLSDKFNYMVVVQYNMIKQQPIAVPKHGTGSGYGSIEARLRVQESYL